jgi:hypothetical protein
MSSTEVECREAAIKNNVPFEYNSRFILNPQSITDAAKRMRRASHAALDDAFLLSDDWKQTDQLAKRRLLRTGDVVYYRNFETSGRTGMILGAPPWALDLLSREGKDFGCTDAKHDTTGGKTFFSTLRVLTKRGSFCVAAWICPSEDEASISTALTYIAKNIPCCDPECPHTVEEHWSECKEYYWTERVCAAASSIHNRCAYLYSCTCMSTCVCACVYVYVHMYAYMCVCVYVCMHTYTCVCVYIYV